MKKFIACFIVSVVLVTNMVAATAFDYLTKSLVNVISLGTVIQLKGADFEYKEGGALWGCYLEGEANKTLSAQFDAGVEYLILAASDDLAIDIDLKVYQGQGSDGILVTKDTASDGAPVVRFTPESSGWYTFSVENASLSGAFASVILLRYKKNAGFSFDALDEAVGNILVCAQNVAQYSTKIPPSQWTLFGGSIAENEQTGFYDLRLPSGAYFLLGAGDDSITNVDAYVVEQDQNGSPQGRRVSSNSEQSYPIDIAIFRPNTSKYYSLEVFNGRSRNSSAFVFGFLIQAY
jgi:hypothetical protein